MEPGGNARRLLLRRALGAGIVVADRQPPAQRQRRREIVVDNFTFSPTPLNVKAGSTVTWVNHDDIPHSIVCPALKLKSHPLDTDESFSLHSSTRRAPYDYICGLHPHMHGQVVVAA